MLTEVIEFIKTITERIYPNINPHFLNDHKPTIIKGIKNKGNKPIIEVI